MVKIMSTYLIHRDDDPNSLTHYGVKGMKWRHHKRKTKDLTSSMHDLYDNALSGVSSAQQHLAEAYGNAYNTAHEFWTAYNENKKKKGGSRPIAREVKVTGKGKGVKRRESVHNSLNIANPAAQEGASFVRNFFKSYMGLAKASPDKPKTKKAASLGKYYVKSMHGAFKSYFGY